MHDTALKSGQTFSETYGQPGFIVVDIGGRDVNGSLRPFFTEKNMKYICVDMEVHPSVDIVVEPGNKLPFDNASVDLIVSTSCFEHDPCFWMTFKEMTRIIKPTGYIYINAPTAGHYHGYPGDNWRFYSDAGQALAYWSGMEVNGESYPVKVVETFNILGDSWNDFVCVWQRTAEKEQRITVSYDIINSIGPMEIALNNKRILTRKRC